jgi:CRISPR-associated protein Cmr6
LKRLDLEGFRDQGTVKTFRGIFGSLDHAGWVVFFDAAPRGRVAMALDIMNPHYPQYYRGGDSSPHDADNPTPIQFLAVDRGVSFGFAVAPRQTAVKRQVQAAEIAKEGMTRALRQFGIGAKTTSGYGRFGRSRPITLQRGPEEPPIPSPTPKQRRPSRPEPSAGDESSSGSDRISKQAADFMKFLQQQSEEDD